MDGAGADSSPRAGKRRAWHGPPPPSPAGPLAPTAGQQKRAGPPGGRGGRRRGRRRARATTRLREGVRERRQVAPFGLQPLEVRAPAPRPGPGMAGLIWAGSWELWGTCPHQALADPLRLRCLQQIAEVLALLQLGRAKKGFPGGLQRNRDREMPPMPAERGRCVLHLATARAFPEVEGRCSSWGKVSVLRSGRGVGQPLPPALGATNAQAILRAASTSFLQ